MSSKQIDQKMTELVRSGARPYYCFARNCKLWPRKYNSAALWIQHRQDS